MLSPRPNAAGRLEIARIAFAAVAGGALLLAAPRPAPAQAAPSGVVPALVRQGDSAWTARRYDAAGAAYGRAVSLDTAGSTRALFRLAVLRSWANELDQAIHLFRRYVQLEPRDDEGRIALARTLAWRGDYAGSVALYDSVLARDRTSREAALGAAQALAWAGRPAASLTRYEAWLRDHPDDQEADLARARTLAWAGRLREAERAYARLESRGERLEAGKGLALVAAWRGDLRTSESRWRQLTQRAPRDPEVWVGLAQVERWAGRPEDARASLRRALEADPDNADARKQLRWVAADLASTTEPSVTALWDSDGNRTGLVTLGATARPLPRVRLGVAASYREASLGALDRSSRALSGTARLDPSSWLTLRGELGGARLDGSAGTRTIAGVHATVRPVAALGLGGSWGRRPFDETAPLIDHGIELGSLAGEAELRLVARVTASGGYERATIDGGSVPNVRRGGFGRLSWRPDRHWTLGLGARALRYDASPRDGYFSPRRFQHGEAALTFTTGRDLGVGFTADLGVGLQRVTFDGPADQRGTQRVGGALAWRPDPGWALELSYRFSNVAGATAGLGAGSVYHASVLGFAARMSW